jgi:zinc-ribbon domain
MTAAGLACRTCGTELQENARFCHACGSSVASSHEPAEYKQVTVLFANVVRSMDIASTIGCGAVARNHDGAGQRLGERGAALWGTPLG